MPHPPTMSVPDPPCVKQQYPLTTLTACCRSGLKEQSVMFLDKCKRRAAKVAPVHASSASRTGALQKIAMYPPTLPAVPMPATCNWDKSYCFLMASLQMPKLHDHDIQTSLFHRCTADRPLSPILHLSNRKEVHHLYESPAHSITRADAEKVSHLLQ